MLRVAEGRRARPCCFVGIVGIVECTLPAALRRLELPSTDLCVLGRVRTYLAQAVLSAVNNVEPASPVCQVALIAPQDEQVWEAAVSEIALRTQAERAEAVGRSTGFDRFVHVWGEAHSWNTIIEVDEWPAKDPTLISGARRLVLALAAKGVRNPLHWILCMTAHSLSSQVTQWPWPVTRDFVAYVVDHNVGDETLVRTVEYIAGTAKTRELVAANLIPFNRRGALGGHPLNDSPPATIHQVIDDSWTPTGLWDATRYVDEAIEHLASVDLRHAIAWCRAASDRVQIQVLERDRSGSGHEKSYTAGVEAIPGLQQWNDETPRMV